MKHDIEHWSRKNWLPSGVPHFSITTTSTSSPIPAFSRRLPVVLLLVDTTIPLTILAVLIETGNAKKEDDVDTWIWLVSIHMARA